MACHSMRKLYAMNDPRCRSQLIAVKQDSQSMIWLPYPISACGARPASCTTHTRLNQLELVNLARLSHLRSLAIASLSDTSGRSSQDPLHSCSCALIIVLTSAIKE